MNLQLSDKEHTSVWPAPFQYFAIPLNLTDLCWNLNRSERLFCYVGSWGSVDTNMPLSSVSEDELLLSGDEKGDSLRGSHSQKTVYRQTSRKASSARIIALAGLLSSILSVIATIITNKVLSTHFDQHKEENTDLLPGLDIPICMFPLDGNYDIEK
jgi:hypothetical protein